MSDFDDWMKGQAMPKTKAEKPSGSFDAWMKGEDKPRPQPRNLLPTERQEFRLPIVTDFNKRMARPQPERSMPALHSGPLAEARAEHGRRIEAMTPGVGGNIAIGGERGYRKYLEPALASLGEVAGGVASGDFRPLGRMVGEAARGTYRALTPPTPRVTADNRVEMRPPDPVLQQAQREREQRYQASPQGQHAAQRLSYLDQRASLDPSISSKITRGTTEFLTGAAPTVAAAIASRGALPIIGLTAGLQSANNPGQMLPNAAAEMLPAPAIAPLVRRLRGRTPKPQESLNPTVAAPVATRQTVEIPRVNAPQARQTAEIPQVPTSPTRPIEYPDAPATQEMPSFAKWMEAENAATAEIPVTLPRRPKTESLPSASDENIQALRSRQEELGRLAYDRRGDFTGDLRDEYNRLNSIIREYDNARTPKELAPPVSNRPERFAPPAEEREARRAALQPRTGPMPETLTPGRKVTQEMQVPGGLKKAESFSSREDARQGHFERFDDEELVGEIRRMEEVQNQGIRGKVDREALEANRFDLKVAVEMQKERRRLQEQIGIDPANRIAPRTPGRQARKIQHSTLGMVTESANQKGVPSGKIRVDVESGGESIIQNPRTTGNRSAAFVKSIPDEAMPELQAKGAPPSPLAGKTSKPASPINYTIPDEAMPEMRSRSTVMGAGPGSLQPLFEGKPKQGQQELFGEGPKSLSRKEIAETAGGVQTLSQLGNPRFVIRNVVQHVAFGKQERAATRIAAALDWAISKGSGKPRQVYAPRGSDLKAYVQNWGKAVQAYKAGKPLPGKPNADYLTADANKLDKAVSKVMTWMNEIPDAANWQTRFEGSLQSIMGGKKLKAPADMDAIIDQATMEANKASLRDENFVSVALQKIKQGLNKASSPIFGTDKFGVGDFILKYAQTPGAVLKRGIERSPLGLFEVAKAGATPGPFRRRNTLLALSRVVEGGVTGAGLGAALAAAGVLVGPEEESKTGKAMEREEGVKGYSLNASALRRLMTGESTEMQDGDTLYSIDWLQPWAMNLSSGAALWNLHKDGKMGVGTAAKTTGEAIYNSLSKTLEVMGDQSVLKNLGRYISRASGETFGDQFLSFMKAVGVDIPSSFVPSSVRQIRQVADPFERDTRAENRGGFRGFMEEAGNRALSQIPGVSQTFPTRPSLLTGEDRKTSLGEMSPLSRAAAQFSPANISTFTPRPVAREISRLNRAGESVSISFPAPTVDKKTGTREATSSLRSRERKFAEAFSKLSQELIADPLYKESDNATKAEAFAGLKRYLRGLGKEDFEEKGMDEIIEAAIETVEKRREKDEN